MADSHCQFHVSRNHVKTNVSLQMIERKNGKMVDQFDSIRPKLLITNFLRTFEKDVLIW